MKKFFVMLLCLCLLFVFTCGCDAKSNSASSDTSSADKSNEIPLSAYEKYLKDLSEYWQTYEGTPPENKIYTIYSTQLSDVKAGIVADPSTDILAVEDISQLYFGFIDDCNNKQKPITYRTIAETPFDGKSPPTEVEYNGKTYIIDYMGWDSQTIIEKHIIAGEEYQFVKTLDKYRVLTEKEDLVAIITAERETGRIVDFELRVEEVSQEDITPISKEAAKQKIVEYVTKLCGEDIAKHIKAETAEISGGKSGWSLFLPLYIDEYRIDCCLYVSILADGTLQRLNFSACSHFDALKTAFDKYGKEAFDKAKAVLESAVDLTDAVFYIAYDSDGRLFCVAVLNKWYTSYPICDGIHTRHYAVEIK